MALRQGVPSLVWFLFKALLYVESGSSFSTLPPEAKLDVLVAAVEIVIALLLFLKSRQVASWMMSIDAGVKKAP